MERLSLSVDLVFAPVCKKAKFIVSGYNMDAPIDAVVDAIDTLIPKIHLIKTCMDKKIPLWSSMSSASRIDPSLIHIGDISETKVDPLAKQVRLKLREIGISEGFKTVYSTEMPYEPEKAIPGTEWTCICPNVIKEFGACHQKRVILGTTSDIPPIFGMMLAGDLIKEHLKDFDLRNRDTFHHTPTFEEFKKHLSSKFGYCF